MFTVVIGFLSVAPVPVAIPNAVIPNEVVGGYDGSFAILCLLGFWPKKFTHPAPPIIAAVLSYWIWHTR